MSQITDHILQLHGAAALLVVFLLRALESSAFVGLIFPGEIAVLLGGVMAFQHRVPLAAVMGVAVAGALIDDAVGYAVGRRWGRRLLRGRIGRLVGAERLDRAETYLRERGGKAVLLGRWTAALRALIPGLAGMSGIPYRTFTAYNVAGGTIWAISFVLLGYVAGTSWRRVEVVAKGASILLLLLVVVVAGVVIGVRWIARNRGGT